MEIQIARRDVEQARDYLAGKMRKANYDAGARKAKHDKPATEAAEKLVAEKFLAFYEAFLASWKMQRNLLNAGIGTYGAFNGSSQIVDLLGVPVGPNSAFAEIFRDLIAAGHVRKMPAGFVS
jgi:hypothetical protein